MRFKTLLLRSETKPGERRTPLLPEQAARLASKGLRVLVERYPERVFSDEEYAAAGCDIVPADSWRKAGTDTFVLGLKELPDEESPLGQTHCYFAHCFKGQSGARKLLNRFGTAGGRLYDLEFLTDAEGRRVAAFGYWAGFMGAAMGVLAWGHQKSTGRPLSGTVTPWGSVEELKAQLRTLPLPPRALITGHLGRSGRGAGDLLSSLGIPTEKWDLAETRAGGPFPAMAQVPLLVHCVASRSPQKPFLSAAEIDSPDRQLSVLADVTCDNSGPLHLFPFFTESTTLTGPTLRVREGAPVGGAAPGVPPLDVIAIDHLPTLLPRESSAEFAGLLFPHLEEFLLGAEAKPFAAAATHFENHLTTRGYA